MHTIDWNRTPLIPAIAQDESGAVLMLAYMNKEALERTLATREVHYFSRQHAKAVAAVGGLRQRLSAFVRATKGRCMPHAAPQLLLSRDWAR